MSSSDTDSGMSGRDQQVFDVVRAKVLEVLEDLDPQQVTPDRSLLELGANSLDRVEVAMLAMEALELRVPSTELAGATSLRELSRVLAQHLDAR